MKANAVELFAFLSDDSDAACELIKSESLARHILQFCRETMTPTAEPISNESVIREQSSEATNETL